MQLRKQLLNVRHDQFRQYINEHSHPFFLSYAVIPGVVPSFCPMVSIGGAPGGGINGMYQTSHGEVIVTSNSAVWVTLDLGKHWVYGETPVRMMCSLMKIIALLYGKQILEICSTSVDVVYIVFTLPAEIIWSNS